MENIDDNIIQEAESLLNENNYKTSSDNTKELSVKEMMAKMLEMQQDNIKSPVATIEPKKKPVFNWPRLWSKKIANNSAGKDTVVVLYFNQKGYIEEPIVAKISSGNMVIIRNTVFEFDPRAMWLVKIGKNVYKVLCIKEIDRRPISNLDVDEVRQRGDATSSDEFLIKAALAQQTGIKDKKPIPTWLIIVIGVIILGALGWFLLNPSTAAAAATP